jgi:multiple antibiotic resistance protein
MDGSLLAQVFVTLLVIMDPPGAVPVFLSVTHGMSAGERNRAALVAVLTAFLVITLFALGGQALLDHLSVSIEAMQVSGGLLLLLVALQLLTGQGPGEAATDLSAQRGNIAMVPLGTPLLAGPGAIAATIVFVQASSGRDEVLAIAVGIVAVHVVLFLVLRFAEVLRRLLRDTGVILLTRVAGLLLAAIAVQLVADGITAFVQNA